MSAPDLTQALEKRREKSIRLVGFGLFGLVLLLAVSLFLLAGAAKPAAVYFIGNWTMTHGQILVLAVLVGGALGGCIHVATSFSDYVGNDEYKHSWEWWYLLRPFIGGCLALAFYFLIRGGLLSLTAGTDQTQEPSFYGMVAIAFLVGMFSKQATDKLDDVFDTLFKSNKDAERKDGLEPKPPVLTAIDPVTVAAGSPDQKVVIAGKNFSGATVKVNGTDRVPTLVQDDRIELTFTADELKTPATYQITVLNAAGAGAATLNFTVTERRVTEGGAADDRGDGGAQAGAESSTPAIDITNVVIEPSTGAEPQPDPQTTTDPAGTAAQQDASGSDTAGPANANGAAPAGTEPTGEQEVENAAPAGGESPAGPAASTTVDDAAATQTQPESSTATLELEQPAPETDPDPRPGSTENPES